MLDEGCYEYHKFKPSEEETLMVVLHGTPQIPSTDEIKHNHKKIEGTGIDKLLILV